MKNGLALQLSMTAACSRRVLTFATAMGVAFATQLPIAPAAVANEIWRVREEVAFTAAVDAVTRGVASIQMSPDERWLYATTLGGALLRWPIDGETGALGAEQRFAPPEFQHEDGPRGLIGLAFDPVDPSVLWVTDNYPVALMGSTDKRPDFSGRVTRVRIADGPAFDGVVEVYLRGLPRSCSDHLSNSLQFRANPDAGEGGGAHLLYLTQGSNSAMGEADRGWCFRPERLLSAAVLEIDPSRSPPDGGFDVATEPLPGDGANRRFGYTWVLRNLIWPSDDGDLKNDAIDIDSGEFSGMSLRFDAAGVAEVRDGPDPDSPLVRRFYDPYAPDAVARIFATGVRNGYDLTWHPNGWLYVANNGSVAGGNAPNDPRTEANEYVSRLGRAEDHLYRIGRGFYGGHANPLRDEFIVNGGNPTEGEDPHQIDAYPVGTQPDPRYDLQSVFALGYHWSPNGLVVYDVQGSDSPLDGALLMANYSRGDNIRAVFLDEEGRPALETFLRYPDGVEISFRDPLDVAMGPGGRLYLSTLLRSNGQSEIVRLTPEAMRPDLWAQ